uniref:Uncharacterized protein n=1 Tax=Spongospora subterranea TaxID=70186 RepID=A0A0H5RAL8_9EUKA|eukprot:CRZ11113.1 hypothetical protein [Spongospora subterranea]
MGGLDQQPEIFAIDVARVVGVEQGEHVLAETIVGEEVDPGQGDHPLNEVPMIVAVAIDIVEHHLEEAAMAQSQMGQQIVLGNGALLRRVHFAEAVEEAAQFGVGQVHLFGEITKDIGQLECDFGTAAATATAAHDVFKGGGDIHSIGRVR